jgi:hypothetical protein
MMRTLLLVLLVVLALIGPLYGADLPAQGVAPAVAGPVPQGPLTAPAQPFLDRLSIGALKPVKSSQPGGAVSYKLGAIEDRDAFIDVGGVSQARKFQAVIGGSLAWPSKSARTGAGWMECNGVIIYVIIPLGKP